jgi:SAM-dependent methyltransferase
MADMQNIDRHTVDGFGEEWSKFDYKKHDAGEIDEVFEAYFSVFPWDELPEGAVGFDAGCGSGRWANRVAPRVGRLHCVDAAERALAVAKSALAAHENCEFHHRSLAELPFDDGSMDFGYSLGVLHHIPDTAAGIAACARKLKKGAPFLVYIYYALENRPLHYRIAFHASEAVRGVTSTLPFPVRYAISQAAAVGVYWPLARGALLLERLGMNVEHLPLTDYRHRSFYVLRTDALDRFGTKLANRFTRDEIASMMKSAGLGRIRFRETTPFWCAVGYKE